MYVHIRFIYILQFVKMFWLQKKVVGNNHLLCYIPQQKITTVFIGMYAPKGTLFYLQVVVKHLGSYNSKNHNKHAVC